MSQSLDINMGMKKKKAYTYAELSRHPYGERSESYIRFQELYLVKYGDIFPKVVFNLDDQGSKIWPVEREFSMTYHRDQPERKSLCVPDWTFWHWPSSGIQDSMGTFRAISSAGDIPPEMNKVGWFGNIFSPGHEVPEHKTRRQLVNHFGMKYPSRFDFHHAGRKGKEAKKFISQPDMVRRYRWLLDIGGAGYSGRTKFLLFSGRPLLMVERRYIEYFTDDLIPWEHYIPVKEDLSDLLDRHEWLEHNDREALKIAARAKEYALENFTMDAIMERFRRVFLDFAEP
jgi:hypothetical protein